MQFAKIEIYLIRGTLLLLTCLEMFRLVLFEVSK
jgi:hypothetical protein